MLHDIDLTTIRPARPSCRHHPECRPCTLSFRELETGLEVTVSPSLHSIHSGRIDSATVLDGADLQSTVADIGSDDVTFSSGDIGLKFVVHPTGLCSLIPPLLCVRKACFSLIEFFLEHKGIPCRCRNLRLHIFCCSRFRESLRLGKSGPHIYLCQVWISCCIHRLQLEHICNVKLFEVVTGTIQICDILEYGVQLRHCLYTFGCCLDFNDSSSLFCAENSILVHIICLKKTCLECRIRDLNFVYFIILSDRNRFLSTSGSEHQF